MLRVLLASVAALGLALLLIAQDEVGKEYNITI